MKDFKEIVSQFQIDDVFVSAKPLGHGAINETYEIVCEKDHYVLQEINPVVFRHPADVMSNLFLVTEHLKKKDHRRGRGSQAGNTGIYLDKRRKYPASDKG